MIFSFIAKNYDDIVRIMSSQCLYSELDIGKKQSRIQQRLMQYRLDSVLSPEDILIQKENNKEMLNMLFEVKHVIGVMNLKLLVNRYIFNKSYKDISHKFGIKEDTCGKRVRRALRKAREFILTQTYDEELFRDFRKLYEAKSPTIKVKYPSDSAMNTYDKPYIYGKVLRYKTKCTMPEYLAETCHSDIKCPMCQDAIGGSTCKRKDSTVGGLI